MAEVTDKRKAVVGKVRKVKTLQEFKAFVMKGNVLDLAVGIIIGVAFGAVVTSMVNDVLMPPIGLALGGVDFKEAFIVLKDGTPPGPYASLGNATAAGAVTWRFGAFVNALINFLIIAFVIFMVVRTVGKMRAKSEAKEAAAPTEKACPFCAMKVPIAATKCGHCTSSLPAT